MSFLKEIFRRDREQKPETLGDEGLANIYRQLGESIGPFVVEFGADLHKANPNNPVIQQPSNPSLEVTNG